MIEDYLNRKNSLRILPEHEFNLIELNDNDLEHLDDILPRKLLSYGITVN